MAAHDRVFLPLVPLSCYFSLFLSFSGLFQCIFYSVFLSVFLSRSLSLSTFLSLYFCPFLFYLRCGLVRLKTKQLIWSVCWLSNFVFSLLFPIKCCTNLTKRWPSGSRRVRCVCCGITTSSYILVFYSSPLFPGSLSFLSLLFVFLSLLSPLLPLLPLFPLLPLSLSFLSGFLAFFCPFRPFCPLCPSRLHILFSPSFLSLPLYLCFCPHFPLLLIFPPFHSSFLISTPVFSISQDPTVFPGSERPVRAVDTELRWHGPKEEKKERERKRTGE